MSDKKLIKPNRSYRRAAIWCLISAVGVALLFMLFVNNLQYYPKKPDFFASTWDERRAWEAEYGGAVGGYITGIVLTSVAFAALVGTGIPLWAIYSHRKIVWKEALEERNEAQREELEVKQFKEKNKTFCAYCKSFIPDELTGCPSCGASRQKR